MFYTMTVLVTTWLYTFIRTHRISHFRSKNYTLCKLNLTNWKNTQKFFVINIIASFSSSWTRKVLRFATFYIPQDHIQSAFTSLGNGHCLKSLFLFVNDNLQTKRLIPIQQVGSYCENILCSQCRKQVRVALKSFTAELYLKKIN